MNTCNVDGCETKRFGHGYCNMHYKRWKKNGEPGPAKPYRRDGCSVVDCPEPHCGLGFCNTHLVRFKSTGDLPTTLIRRYGEDKGACPRLFCSEKIATKGLCQRHYSRIKLYGKYQKDFSWEQYDSLWDTQGGKCPICSTDLVWDSKLTHVDHCHLTNTIRGLLCNTCNVGLGSFKDNVEHLSAAIEYLNK